MKQISTFKCDYCNETYSNQYTCKQDEINCQKNPTIKSCDSCAFLNNDQFLHPDGFYIRFNGCLYNNDISQFAREGCLDHKDVSFKRDSQVMSLAIREYKYFGAIHNYLQNRVQLAKEMSKAFKRDEG